MARLVEERPAATLEGDGRAAPRAKFVAYRIDASEASNIVSGIAFDGEGRMWCLTYNGLYRAAPETMRFTLVVPHGWRYSYKPLLIDSRARVWPLCTGSWC